MHLDQRLSQVVAGASPSDLVLFSGTYTDQTLFSLWISRLVALQLIKKILFWRELGGSQDLGSKDWGCLGSVDKVLTIHISTEPGFRSLAHT